ncbi:PQQ-binding-like beta-propeller repeat protein, partial [Planctomycetota bacterium]
MQRVVIATIIIVAGALYIVGSAGAEQDRNSNSTDWPNWRGPNHNGISHETDWLGDWSDGQAKILWKQSIGTGFSSMAVSKGRVYTMGNTAKDQRDQNPTDVVYCLDAKTGDIIWTHKYLCDLGARSYKGGTHATPTVEGDSIYTFSKQGHAFCLDATTGKPKWFKDV